MKKLIIVGFAMALGLAHADVIIKDGETIAFVGDEITGSGAQPPCGYICLVMDGLKRAGVKNARTIKSGVSGDNASRLEYRIEKDVLSKNPNWMVFSCGVNDVWQNLKAGLKFYRKYIGKSLDKAQAAGVKVIVLGSTMVGENDEHKMHADQIQFNAALKEEALKRNMIYIDLWEVEKKTLAKMADGTTDNKLTTDGIHMNCYGNQMFAIEILRAMGVEQKVIDESLEDWRSLENAFKHRIGFNLPLYEKICRQAKKDGLAPKDAVKKIIMETVK